MASLPRGQRSGHFGWRFAWAHASRDDLGSHYLDYLVSGNPLCVDRIDCGRVGASVFRLAIFRDSSFTRREPPSFFGAYHCDGDLAPSFKCAEVDSRDRATLWAKMMNIAILGTGGWGTALATQWAHHGNEVTLWGNTPERVKQIASSRRNPDYLPGIELPPSVALTSELDVCAGADLIIFVTPSVALREVAGRLKPALRRDQTILLSCTKGIEHGTGMRMSQILQESFPANPIAVLSGPNLAAEVAQALPTATVLGCRDESIAQTLQEVLGSSRFRVYTSHEIAGIELGGALKNIFAISAGVSDGFGLGDNSKAALVTRSLAELLRLGVAMGGEARTFQGLSGAGDLVATCFSRHSRNRRFGEELGQGKSVAEITNDMKAVAEGVPTARSAFECAQKLGVETPIIDQVYAVLYQGKLPAQGMQELLERDQKSERG
ncbi:MAG TPA: NAD(P)H-dependent glycerol-3-phosphate dehydrogenase [Chthoniobacterales bacterium]|nr:NAD(P)H-dependent glycerol-3-phosphate dehydrogenase [Chthoniobacterales bacterium]